jgi:putative methyltransferase (TIGR01177 family)
MISVWVELSGAHPLLAHAEVIAAAEALGGGASPPAFEELPPHQLMVRVPSGDHAVRLANRLSLSRRCLVAAPAEPNDTEAWLRRQGADGKSASFRKVGHPSASISDTVLPQWVEVYKRGGGRIDLKEPERKFWILSSKDGNSRLLEEVGSVDRSGFQARRMPKYPFQRPISLDPRLARAAVNLARIRPGDRVVDPFVGTGALLIEAALLGARVTGIDRDSKMVRGALTNFAFAGVVPESMTVGDSGEIAASVPRPSWDALVTDLPYGRSSSTGREPVVDLLARVLPPWSRLLRPGGRIVLITSGGNDSIPDPWQRVVSISDRVHRSLTRQFRVYERADGPTRH